jgi:4-diphosphocytidyl-2-C-methyl-D-erythritol kinase
MSKATVTTFAKLNLVLNVFQPERSGGLHPIASIFQTVSLSDQLLITPTQTPGLVLETDHPDLQNPAENLLAKIYTDFQADIPFGLEIRLIKNIPIGGGLGGGTGIESKLPTPI